MIASSVERSAPRARVCSGTFSISAIVGSVPDTSIVLPAARIRATSSFFPRLAVASGDSSRAVTVNGVPRTRPSPRTPTARPIRASTERMSSTPRSASSCIRGST